MARTAQKETENFENMPIRRAVLTLAVPTVIRQLIVMVYNLADTRFIGQTGDPYQVAAVTVAYPLFMLLPAFANLFGIGGSSLISRLLGRQEAENAGRVATFSLWAAGTVSILYGFFVGMFGRPILTLLGSGGATLEFALQYLNWTAVIDALPTVLNMVLANIVRAQGKAKIASIGMSIGGILNIFLDPNFHLHSSYERSRRSAGYGPVQHGLHGGSAVPHHKKSREQHRTRSKLHSVRYASTSAFRGKT